MAARAPDVVVIGAGIIGCAIARELSKRRMRVVVLESRIPGAGATQASAGVLAPYIEAPDEGPLQALTVRSLALYDDFIAAVQADVDTTIEYRRCGTLDVASDPESASRLQRLGEWTRTVGVDAKWVSPEEVGDLEPALAPNRGGLLVPSHGYVRASQLTAALLEAAQRHGAAFESGRHVDNVEFDGEEATGVAGASRYRTPTVVLAAGSWSSALASRTHVRPVRGQLLQLHVSRPVIQRVLWSERCYIVPWTDGTLLVGATVEDVGFDERVTGAGVRELLDAATTLLPALADATFTGARVGLRPATPTGLPLVERSQEHPSLVFATGHYRNGILLAPLTAQLVADLVG
jgi:glycine oxidase